jgi:hypothetical protein
LVCRIRLTKHSQYCTPLFPLSAIQPLSIIAQAISLANMGSEPNEDQNKEKPMAMPTSSTRNTASEDEVPPMYYDSEPSGQPPKYLHGHSISGQSTLSAKPEAAKTSTTSSSKPTNQHHNSAPTSTIAAILALPHEYLDAQRRAARKNKTLRERWKDFKERNFGDYDESNERTGSAAEWNVQGGRIAGGTATPYRKKSKK